MHRPRIIYPGQTDISDLTGYPDGAARNDVTENDGLGTPLEKLWLTDYFGLVQAVMSEAGITSDDTPEKVADSQFLDALNYLFRDEVRIQPLVLTQDDGNGQLPEDFVFQASPLAWVQQGTAKFTHIPLCNLPAHGNLYSVSLGVGGGLGAGGDWTKIPTGPGSIRVQWIDGAGAVQADTLYADPTTPLAAYNAAHLVTKVLDTPLALDLTTANSQLQIWVRVDSPSDGAFETNKWGFHKLFATFTE